jgi:hypothetical protein
MEKKDEMIVKPKQDLSIYEEFENSLDSDDGTSNQYIVLAKILLMQGLSKQVVETGTSKVGEFRNSLDNRLYGDSKNPVDVIFFAHEVRILHLEGSNGKARFVGTSLETLENMRLPYTDTGPNGLRIINQRVLDFYALVVDGNFGEDFPVIIRFHGMSFFTGRRLVTMFAQMRTRKIPKFAKIISMTNRQDKNDKGIFQVWDYSVKGDSTLEQMRAADRCAKMFRQKIYSIDEKESSEESSVEESNQTKVVVPNVSVAIEDDEIPF